jgi:hypothetical protein
MYYTSIQAQLKGLLDGFVGVRIGLEMVEILYVKVDGKIIM